MFRCNLFRRNLFRRNLFRRNSRTHGNAAHPFAALAGLALVAALALPLILPVAASADDRDLLRESFGDPYVFIVFDTSGSMNWTTKCTAEQAANDLDPTDGGCTSECPLDAAACQRICPSFGCVEFDENGICLRQGYLCVQPLCTERDCFAPMNGDDPRSKFFQAKQALYEVLQDVDNVHFGFSSYNQDGLHMRAKHWMYQASTPGMDIPGWGPYPAPGDQEVFGYQWGCDNGPGDAEVGCYYNDPAHLDDPWELTRVQRLPKGGESFDTFRHWNVRYGGTTYHIHYDPAAGTLSDPVIGVDVRYWECAQDENRCDQWGDFTYIGLTRVDFALVSDFDSWDIGIERSAARQGFYSQSVASDSPAGGSCAGWDPNSDTGADDYNGYSLRFPTTPDPNPIFSPELDYGDVIPLDWRSDNKEAVLNRLAPNRLLGEARPDFRVARYFRDGYDPGEDFLRLRNDSVRPLLPNGSTPLGFAIADYRTWWAGCEQGSCSGDTGWSDVAAQYDPDWACRKKYLLVISDGDDTCPGRDPCSFTAALRAQENVKTYVVAFGVEGNPHNKLTCMASNGGTGEPIYPQNKDELVRVLRDIFGEIREEARAFASAAVPSVQAETQDAIYLSSFTPLNNESVWDGHLDAFLKPLPLTEDGRPDEATDCASLPADQRAECHLWDAGEVLLTQAPTAAEVVANNLKLGNAADERRVFYPQAKDLLTGAVPNERRLFTPPSSAGDKQDLWDALGLAYTVPDDLDNAGSPPQLTSEAVIRRTLVQKEAVIDNPDGTQTPITYVLGDIFHSDPVVVDSPSDFRAYAGDYYSDGTACADGNPGYRCYAEKHQRRRRLLAVGSNEGMMHFFDAGIYDPSTEGYTNGTGTELFAHMPRLTLPVVKELAEGPSQYFSVDATLRVIDVFIDPVHSSGDPPDAAEREWRTVGIGGLREAGIKQGGSRVQLDNGRPFSNGYYALDLTQPDALNSDNEPVNQSIVPGCLTAYNSSACGPARPGAELWEFTDSVDGSPAEWGTAMDEDRNSFPDLADTWSVPVIGRVKVLAASGDEEDRWVAIFGGGFDPENRGNPQRGGWLYMVDIETGETLYKRQLEGAVPSNPAAVDRNRDGYIDLVYIGTTAGYLYKVDVGTPVPLRTVRAYDLTGTRHEVQRIDDRAWDPFIIFDTLADGVRRPIFFPPAVVVVAEISRFALAFGVGDREQLWDMNGTEGRFYFIVDENFRDNDPSLPMDEADYQILDSDSAFNPDSDFVLNPPAGLSRGWVMTLDPDERVVADAFSVSGVTVFPTFKPQVVVSGTDEAVCARTGDSRVFVVFSNNADPILPPENGVTSRSMLVGEALVTPPFVDQSATKNPADGQQDPERQAWEDAIRESLKDLFPPGTRFANYSIGVTFIRSDTGLVGPIPIPVGIVIKNWKEF